MVVPQLGLITILLIKITEDHLQKNDMWEI